MDVKRLQDYLHHKGFKYEGGTVGCSYLNFYFTNQTFIMISDEEGSIDFNLDSTVIISFNDETGETIGLCNSSNFPFMQFSASANEVIENLIERLFAVNEIYQQLIVYEQVIHDEALLTALHLLGFRKK